MTNANHRVDFGVTLTPQNKSPETVLELTLLAEHVGLDLVTFQDHPTVPGFLDGWTLLSFVAGRCNRIRLASSVANLPLRQPTVLGKAAASLDLLSNGRFELGLGAGYFLDAIAAMGGRHLQAGESVDALSEAIDIIRGVWDVGHPDPLSFKGRYYQVRGAERGPQPAHSIGLWIGAYKPRMLRLTGAKADAWLSSTWHMRAGDHARGNAMIDEAAREAGREPHEIRRIFNIRGQFSSSLERGELLVGPPEHWIDQLTKLSISNRISTFILSTDDANDIVTFAELVAPAVRATA